MKIEKLAENKIRITLKKDDFKDKNINIKHLLSSKQDSQKLYLELLNKAEKQANFVTDGYKLLIDSFVKNNEVFVCTITKYSRSNICSNNNLIHIYRFLNFNDFCEFCNCLHKSSIKYKRTLKGSNFYFYNNSYYLVLKNIKNINKISDLQVTNLKSNNLKNNNLKNNNLKNANFTNTNFSNTNFKIISNIILEFAYKVNYSESFEYKLIEYGEKIF